MCGSKKMLQQLLPIVVCSFFSCSRSRWSKAATFVFAIIIIAACFSTQQDFQETLPSHYKRTHPCQGWQGAAGTGECLQRPTAPVDNCHYFCHQSPVHLHHYKVKVVISIDKHGDAPWCSNLVNIFGRRLYSSLCVSQLLKSRRQLEEQVFMTF